jgi:hypothetical protein
MTRIQGKQRIIAEALESFCGNAVVSTPERHWMCGARITQAGEDAYREVGTKRESIINLEKYLRAWWGRAQLSCHGEREKTESSAAVGGARSMQRCMEQFALDGKKMQCGGSDCDAKEYIAWAVANTKQDVHAYEAAGVPLSVVQWVLMTRAVGPDSYHRQELFRLYGEAVRSCPLSVQDDEAARAAIGRSLIDLVTAMRRGKSRNELSRALATSCVDRVEESGHLRKVILRQPISGLPKPLARAVERRGARAAIEALGEMRRLYVQAERQVKAFQEKDEEGQVVADVASHLATLTQREQEAFLAPIRKQIAAALFTQVQKAIAERKGEEIAGVLSGLDATVQLAAEDGGAKLRVEGMELARWHKTIPLPNPTDGSEPGTVIPNPAGDSEGPASQPLFRRKSAYSDGTGVMDDPTKASDDEPAKKPNYYSGTSKPAKKPAPASRPSQVKDLNPAE